MGRDAAQLRGELRELVEHPCAGRLFGRVHRQPGRPRNRPAVLSDAGRQQPAVSVVAGGVRRRRGVGVGADRGARGDVGPPRAPRRPVHGRQLGRADHHAPRHRRTAAQAPSAHRARRGDLVSGLLGAGGGLRPGVAAHHRAPGRRRLAGQRSEDLDVLRHDGAVVLPARAHAQGGEEAAGVDDFSCPDG